MKTYTSWPDMSEIRSGKPRAIRLVIRNDTDFLTFADGRPDSNASNTKTVYAMIGGDYGWLHTSAGEIRIFKSASSAYRVAREYVGF